MRYIKVSGLMLALLAVTQQHKLAYKSDEMDDILEGVITNKHKDPKAAKPKGAVDTLV